MFTTPIHSLHKPDHELSSLDESSSEHEINEIVQQLKRDFIDPNMKKIPNHRFKVDG
jgi:polysaccharide deacetylase 2 family uncharacterized protein YibQ